MSKFLTGLAAILLVACTTTSGHAAGLCPAGTKTVVIIEKGSDPAAPTVVLPSEGGDYSDSPVMKWDISNGKDVQFQADCNPNETGFTGVVPVDVPMGVNGCSFGNGVLTCE